MVDAQVFSSTRPEKGAVQLYQTGGPRQEVGIGRVGYVVIGLSGLPRTRQGGAVGRGAVTTEGPSIGEIIVGRGIWATSSVNVPRWRGQNPATAILYPSPATASKVTLLPEPLGASQASSSPATGLSPPIALPGVHGEGCVEALVQVSKVTGPE